MKEIDYLLVLENMVRITRDLKTDTEFIAFVREKISKCLDDLDACRAEKERMRAAKKGMAGHEREGKGR